MRNVVSRLNKWIIEFLNNTMDDINSVIKKIEQLQNTFGLWGAIIIISLVVILIFSVWYLKKTLPEVALKEFQSALDQDLFKFKSKHEKQINAVHSIYQKFQKMTTTVDYTKKGKKFPQPLKPKEEIEILIKLRHEFKRAYQKNRLLFSKELCKKIDNAIDTIDKFIETYQKRLLDLSEDDIKRTAELNQGVYIAGMWGLNEFDGILEDLKQIRIKIEDEFRKIYGTYS